MSSTVADPVPAYRCFDVVVGSVSALSPHFVRVTFTGDDLDLFGDTCLDQRVKVVLPIPGSGDAGTDPYEHFPRTADWYERWRQLPADRQNPFRTYTVRAVRHDLREVDVDFVCHGDTHGDIHGNIHGDIQGDTGVASAWVQRARQGERCVLVGPDRRGDSARVGVEWKPGGATSVLVAGDETAVPAISSILASLPAHVCGQVFIEVPTADDVLPLDVPRGVEVTWLPRSGAEQDDTEHGARLVAAVTTALAVHPPTAAENTELDQLDQLEQIDVDNQILWETPASEPGNGVFAWLAGEASTITTLRRHLVSERGWDRRRIAFMGYWRAGRSEA